MNVLDDLAEVEAIVASARAAQLRFEANGSQVRYDRAATGMPPAHVGRAAAADAG